MLGRLPTGALTLAPVALTFPQGLCRGSSHFQAPSHPAPTPQSTSLNPRISATPLTAPKSQGPDRKPPGPTHSRRVSGKCLPGSTRRAGTTGWARHGVGRHPGNTCRRALQLHGGTRRCGFMTTGRRPALQEPRCQDIVSLVKDLPRAKGQKKKCLGFGRQWKGQGPRSLTI